MSFDKNRIVIREGPLKKKDKERKYYESWNLKIAIRCPLKPKFLETQRTTKSL